MSYMEFRDWLMGKMREWEGKDRKNFSAFARYLDVNQGSLSQWFSGSYVPGQENVEKIAAKLGPEVYDVLGLPRPDPAVEEIVEITKELTPEEKEELVSVVHQWLREHGGRRIK
jgi:transcriptional regulator with XRE-family HTH domain